jgi:hypothetical protein
LLKPIEEYRGGKPIYRLQYRKGGIDMTQELVVGALLTGLVGLIWVRALSLLPGEPATPESRKLRVSSRPAGRPTV